MTYVTNCPEHDLESAIISEHNIGIFDGYQNFRIVAECPDGHEFEIEE